MSTLDTLIQYLKELREKEGRDIPLYLVDNDYVEVALPSSFKDAFSVGYPTNTRWYDEDKSKPRGLRIAI